MRFCLIVLSLITVYCVAGYAAAAQINTGDSLFRRSAIAYAINTYQQSAGDQSGLYNGSLYPEYPFTFKEGSPFFLSDTWSTGSITYDHIPYNNIKMLYDNMKGVVIIEDNFYRMQLFEKKVNAFNIAGHSFIRPENLTSDMPAGFYELLYDGKIDVLKKEIKSIHQDASVYEGIERSIIQSDNYYIRKNNLFYPIRKESDILAALIDKKKGDQAVYQKKQAEFS